MPSDGSGPSLLYGFGILGAVGGFCSLAFWFVFLIGNSPSVHGEIAPLLTFSQVVFLTSLLLSSALGLSGAMFSRMNARVGGGIVLVAAVVGAASVIAFSGLLTFPVYGFWTIVMLAGGLYGVLARQGNSA